MSELLEAVASGRAIAITGASVPETYRHSEVTYVPITDVAPCPISLCTRVNDLSPFVAELRRAVEGLRGAGGR